MRGFCGATKEARLELFLAYTINMIYKKNVALIKLNDKNYIQEIGGKNKWRH